MDYHTQLRNLLTSLTLFVLMANAQKADRDIGICEDMTESRARLVHIYNPDFPQYSPASRHCNCTVSSSNGLPLTVSIRIFISSSPTSLMLKYQQADTPMTWIGFSSNITSSDLTHGGFFITDSASSVEVIYRHTETLKSIFALDVRAFNGSDELRISCKNTTTEDNSSSMPDGVISYLETFCSAYTIIILGSLCTAFFLIIITLSVMLCCTVKKSKKFNLRHSSSASQPLSNQSSLGLPMESYRVASRIYDDGMACRRSTNGDQPAPRHHSVPAVRDQPAPRHHSVPAVRDRPAPRHHSVPEVRESVAYTNTMDMNLYGNT